MIRLTLILPELEQRYSIQHGIRERIKELTFMAERKEPVAIVPCQDHDGRIISAVLLTETTDLHSETSIRISFRPIWCKTFTVCSYTKDTLLALVCEFDNGQFWIDHTGARKCKMTTNGDGTDPKVVHRSQYALGDLLVERPRPSLVNNVIELIQQNC